MMVLLTGGSKSGKSSLAEELVQRLADGQAPIYLATMQVINEEDQGIVARHRRKREGKSYLVIEQSRDVGSIPLARDSVLLLEDVPNLLAGEMFGGQGADRALSGILSLAGSCRHLVVVTNEVGSDGIAYLPETLEYITALGQLNQKIASMADVVAEVVSGIPCLLKGELPCICSNPS